MKYSTSANNSIVWVGKFQCNRFICVRLFFVSFHFVFVALLFKKLNFLLYFIQFSLGYFSVNVWMQFAQKTAQRACVGERDKGRKHSTRVQKNVFFKIKKTRAHGVVISFLKNWIDTLQMYLTIQHGTPRYIAFRHMCCNNISLLRIM